MRLKNRSSQTIVLMSFSILTPLSLIVVKTLRKSPAPLLPTLPTSLIVASIVRLVNSRDKSVKPNNKSVKSLV